MFSVVVVFLADDNGRFVSEVEVEAMAVLAGRKGNRWYCPRQQGRAFSENPTPNP